MEHITIAAKPRRAKRYRSLLTSSWDAGILVEALDLVRDVLADSGLRVSLPWEARKQDFAITEGASEHLRHLFFTFQYDKTMEDFPVLPSRRSSKTLALAQSALASAIFLNFQSIAKASLDIVLDDTSAFLRNCQSLLYVSVIGDLLPELNSRRLRSEERFLVHALRTHSLLVWQDTPSHSAYLTGILSSYLNEGEIAQNALEFSFSATDTDDHDYLSKAHRLWYHYLDTDQVEKAKNLVLHLYRSAKPEDLTEVKEMLDDTYGDLAMVHRT